MAQKNNILQSVTQDNSVHRHLHKTIQCQLLLPPLEFILTTTRFYSIHPFMKGVIGVK